jgi:hypothetical protein
MKKLFYILLFAFSSALTFTACSDEEVNPSTELDNGGGGVSTDGRN